MDLLRIQDLRITINERERFGNKIRVQGKVECGVLKKAQTVMIMPENISAMVVDISVATEDVSAAYPGELVTMFIRGVGESDFSIGSVMCDDKNPTLPVKKITALVQLCKEETIMKGKQLFSYFLDYNAIGQVTLKMLLFQSSGSKLFTMKLIFL